jgi:hypothetical protein
VSQDDVQIWALMIGFLVFAGVVAVLFGRRRASEREAGDLADPTEYDPWTGAAMTTLPDGLPSREATSSRRRPSPPPPTGGPGELASAIRSLILRAVAERAPAGWSALVLCPPPHPDQMSWHVHLAPEVALDLRDGRTVTVAAPLPSHEWRLAGGRTVGVGDGEPEPAPTDDTVTVRVTGAYLIVALTPRDGRRPELTARVVTAGEEELPVARASATEVRAVQATLREAVELAIGSRMLGSPPAVGYGRSSWIGHERVWLTIGR